MGTQFRQGNVGEYQPFTERPVYVWTGGCNAFQPEDQDIMGSTEPSYFVFDFEEPGSKDYFWEPKIGEPAKQFLRSICLTALKLRQHFFVILGHPLSLSTSLEDPVHLALLRGELKDIAGGAQPWDYKKFCAHILVGTRISADTIRRPDGSLPWLSTISYVSRFIWVNGALDDDCELDNLKPCSDEVPTAGDYNLFTGEVFWAGTYSYRDSVNAFQTAYNPLTFVLLDFTDGGEALSRSHGRVYDDCLRYEKPYAVVNIPQSAVKTFGDETFSEIAERMNKEISQFATLAA